ncbi:uncharacterized protein LOC122054841 [Zingiber officinale]|uniref:uncharacterized protein LOC122054841 n=1 Tax=Zingiber officinale TaxID=94328 RepID=UPI001C4AA9F5|nr:uncharacterized protein LOC122054841 [Zingiber officinale]
MPNGEPKDYNREQNEEHLWNKEHIDFVANGSRNEERSYQNLTLKAKKIEPDSESSFDENEEVYMMHNGVSDEADGAKSTGDKTPRKSYPATSGVMKPHRFFPGTVVLRERSKSTIIAQSG